MNETPHIHPEDGYPPPPRDELDALLRAWHADNAAKASAGRDRLLAALAAEDARQDAPAPGVIARISPDDETPAQRRPFPVIRRIIVNRYAPLAAAVIVLAVLVPFMLTGPKGFVSRSGAGVTNIVMAPDGGRLDAFDRDGNALGPCALRHTDVQAEISGRFTRVTVVQKYQNTGSDKIEAVYTFPLSDKAGVDKMTMTIGDRVIVGEVKERQQARRLYEEARAANRVASLLEQERPNIFTQSVANIETGATIDITISYVEMVAEHDGEFSFAFPTVVSPRYIPGSTDYARQPRPIPMPWKVRRGLILWAPATILGAELRDAGPGERTATQLQRILSAATPIEPPTQAEAAALPAVWYQATASYPDGSAEPTVLLVDGRGTVGGRWFYCPPTPPVIYQPIAPVPPNADAQPGDNFARPTGQVPDADRITPMPVRPPTRAGHDISLSVTVDTGGPGITSLDSPQHTVTRTDLAKNTNDQPRRVSLALSKLSEIPNRDFVLKWRQTADSIASRVFTHTGDTGNFFTVQLDPPAQVKDAHAVPRELIFVVDTSGSMNGRPIAMCKEVMRKAIDQMRPRDTFNIITFAGATNIMWDRPRPNTPDNRAAAQRFIESWQGRGGTEMMTAINAALTQGPIAGRDSALTPQQLADLPADGRQVAVEADDSVFRNEGLSKDAVTDRAELHLRDDLTIKLSPFQLPEPYLKRANQTNGDDSITLKLILRGAWSTVNGQRILQVSSAELSGDSSVRPLRLVMFLTDAEVGNDFAIIDAIKQHRDTTRVFSFGIGSSVNRFLIEQMAAAGGGEPDFIYANAASEQQAADAVDRFNRRTRTPILTDIRVTFNGVQPLDVLPDPSSVHDLWDNRPLTFMGRYNGSGAGSLTIRAQTATGPWERTIGLDFPARQPENTQLPTLWARQKIDTLINSDLLGTQHGNPNPGVRAKVITLGETFNVLSQYTSFVAVDKLRITIDGKARLVHVPIELPAETNWEGFFGEMSPADEDAVRTRAGASDESGKKVAGRLALKPEAVQQLIVRSEETSNARVFRDRDDKGEAIATRTADDFLAPSSKFDAPSTGAPPVSAPAAPAAVTPPSSGYMDAAASRPARTATPASSRAPAPAERRSETKTTTSASPPATRLAAPALQTAAGGAVTPIGAVQSSQGLSSPLVKDYREEASLLRQGTRGLNAPAQIGSRLTSGLDVRMAGGAGVAAKESDGQLRANRGLGALHFGTAAASEGRSPMLGDIPLVSNEVFDRDASRAYFYKLPSANGLENAVRSSADESLLVIAAAQLIDSGRLDDARRLVCRGTPPVGTRPASAPANPGGVSATAALRTPAEQVCDALAPTVAEADRAAKVGEARQIAAADLLARRRDFLIASTLAPELLALLRPQPTPATSGAPEPATAPPMLTLTILVADATSKTIDALKAAGAIILDVKAEASVVIARVPSEKLEQLALLSVVRRIEPLDDAGMK